MATSNVRKDLNEFQEKHATLVLTTVKVNYYIYFFVTVIICNVIICVTVN